MDSQVAAPRADKPNSATSQAAVAVVQQYMVEHVAVAAQAQAA